MHDLAKLAGAFAVSFTAVIVVALLFRMSGKEPNYLNIVAIPIGITIAEGLRLAWPMSDFLFPFVMGAAIGVSVFAAQFIRAPWCLTNHSRRKDTPPLNPSKARR